MSWAKWKGYDFGLVLALFLIAALLSSIILVREIKGSPPYPNGPSYYNLRIAEELAKDPFLEKDALQERAYSPSAYQYTLSFLLQSLGKQMTLYLAPILLGLLSAFLLYRLLLVLGFPKANASFTLILLGLTPAYLTTYSSLSENGFTILLTLSALLFYFEKTFWDYPWKASGKIFFGISMASLALLLLTSITGFVATILLLLSLSIFQSRNIATMVLALSPSVILFIPIAVFTSYPDILLRNLGFHPFEFKELFSTSGAALGFDIFLTLLFLTGLVILWNYLKEIRIYHLLSILLLCLSSLNPLLRIYMSIIITVYCVVAIKHLYYRNWDQEVIRVGTILLLACALVFSALNQLTTLANAEPDASAFYILKGLRSYPEGVLFTDAEYGFAIQYYSAQKTVLDGTSQLYPDFYELANYSSTLLSSSRIKEAQPLLEKLEIRYILITPKMKEDLWYGREEQLLFLVRHSYEFTKRHVDGELELWEYTPTRKSQET